jgi:KTSC domain
MGAPQTLPADFQGWDKAPATLPAGFDKWDKAGHRGAGSAEDFEKEKTASGSIAPPLTSPWEATKYGLKEFGGGLWDVGKSAAGLFAPPETTAEKASGLLGPIGLPALRMAKGLHSLGEQATQVPAAVKDLAASPDPMGTLALVTPRVGGQTAANLVMAKAPEIAAKVGPPIVRAAAKGANVALAKAPDVVGGAAGMAVGRELGHPYAGSAVGAYLGRRFLPQITIPGEHFGFPDRVVGGPTEAPPYNPGVPLPATPSPEQLNPSLLSRTRTLPGQISPERIFGPRPTPAQPIPPRAGLALAGEVAPAIARPGAAGSIVGSVTAEPPVTEAPPEAPISARPTSRAALGRQLDAALPESLGVEPAKPLRPGVPLKAQIKAAVQASAPLPEGFTPTPDSGAIRGYKYNPETSELEAITNTNQRYVHGDVSPEQFEKFEAADSKGKAWNELRNAPGVVRSAKVVNGISVANTPSAGLRSMVIDPETGQPELASVIEGRKAAAANTPPAVRSATSARRPIAPAPAAAGEDLASEMQASVNSAQRGDVFSSAEPKTLLDRWGVDPESFAEGRSQTRGMKPQETEAQIKALTEAYKKGQTPEPVIEIRDAQNNIVEVDGRGRALAAHKAGIDRIPVIVRRAGRATGTQ